MAPQQQQQQNSTLIDDNLDTCPSMLLNLPESPILPPKHRYQNQDNNNNKNRNKTSNILTNSTKQSKKAQEGELHSYKNKQQSTAKERSKTTGNRQRQRSISLNSVNSTMENGHNEILIWIGDAEQRFVSGATIKTTCNDIIKAIIDDGGSSAAASRDYGDYVITESWRGIERSYDGNMAILPVWRAWNRVHNELRLSMKLRNELKEPMSAKLIPMTMPIPIPTLTSQSTVLQPKNFSLIKWLKKFFRFSQKNKTGTKAQQGTKDPTTTIASTKIIMPDQIYIDKQTNDSQIRNQPYKKTAASTHRKRRRNREESRKSKYSPLNTNMNTNNNCIRRRRIDKPLRYSIRNKLAALHAQMNARYNREYTLTRLLSEKCRLYNLQNQQYTTKEMEISVGQLQSNIEAYADEIIQMENELLNLKNEMKRDISVINNLKRMSSEKTLDAKNELQEQLHIKQSTKNLMQAPPEMQFVDNIYEFCDNNASMLV